MYSHDALAEVAALFGVRVETVVRIVHKSLRESAEVDDANQIVDLGASGAESMEVDVAAAGPEATPVAPIATPSTGWRPRRHSDDVREILGMMRRHAASTGPARRALSFA